MLIRVLVFLSLLALINVFLAQGIIGRWPGAENHLVLAWILAGGFFVLQLTGMIGERTFYRHVRSRRVILALNWASYLAFGVMSTLCVYLLAADAVTIGWMALDGFHTPSASYDRYFLIILAAALALTIGMGVYQAQKGPRIVHVRVPLKNLPRAFEGFKIVQISDLHTGPTIGRAYTENVVRMTQALKPDMVALTGDFIDGHVDVLSPAVAPLADLKPAYGMYFITGNHEYYWGADAWCAHFKTLGADVLRNEHRIVEKDGAHLVIAGVTDYSSGDSSPVRAVQGAPAELVKILLAHQPASYREGYKAGFDLQLSGHTHNGQYFPFTLLIRFFQRFYKGLNPYHNMLIYVSRGTGYWGPPLRTFNRGEITCLTLTSA